MKHRTPFECQQLKELYLDYIICSQVPIRAKQKIALTMGPLDLTEMMGTVPLILLKLVSFLEGLTSILTSDSRTRPVYEKSYKLSEHVLFVIQNTEVFSLLPMLYSILLKRKAKTILPATVLTLTILSIKILNNCFRMDLKFMQMFLNSDLGLQ